jgi:hypothetical protein
MSTYQPEMLLRIHLLISRANYTLSAQIQDFQMSARMKMSEGEWFFLLFKIVCKKINNCYVWGFLAFYAMETRVDLKPGARRIRENQSNDVKITSTMRVKSFDQWRKKKPRLLTLTHGATRSKSRNATCWARARQTRDDSPRIITLRAINSTSSTQRDEPYVQAVQQIDILTICHSYRRLMKKKKGHRKQN